MKFTLKHHSPRLVISFTSSNTAAAAVCCCLLLSAAVCSPSSHQGTVGIYTLPLGSTVLELEPEVQTITVEALAADTFTPLGYFFVTFEGHSSVPISPMVRSISCLRGLLLA